MRFEWDYEESGLWTLSHGHWFLHGINEWEQFLSPTRWNWITFRPIYIEWEWDRMIPGVELEVVLLGLGVRFRWNDDWNKTEAGRELSKPLVFGPPCPSCGHSKLERP